MECCKGLAPEHECKCAKSHSASLLTNVVTPRWIVLTRDGKAMWLDLIDGRFAYGGDLEPNDGARLFLDSLGRLLEERIQEAARKIDKAER